jgi:hypothetical protein
VLKLKVKLAVANVLAATPVVWAVKPPTTDLTGDPASVAVEVVDQTGRDELPAGIDETYAVAVTTSEVAVERYVCVTVTEAAVPGAVVEAAAEIAKVSA